MFVVLGTILSGNGCHRQPAAPALEVGGVRWRVAELKEGRHYLRSLKHTAQLTWELMTATNRSGADFTHWARVDYRLIQPADGLPPAARQRIAATLRHAFLDGEAGDPSASLNSLLAARRDRFFAEYEDFRRQFDTSALRYQDEWRLTPLPPVGGALVVQLDWWSDTGGAHGNGGREYFVFERATGRRLQTADFFPSDAWDRITALLKTAIRRARKLPANQSLAAAGFWEQNLHPTNACWAPAPNGLRFHFGPYDIAPYALGPTDGAIPWPEIAPCLTKHFRALLKVAE